MENDFEALAADVEANGTDDADRALAVATALAATGPKLAVTPEDVITTDAIIHLVDHLLPGWHFLLRGRAREPNGKWSCTLRRSEGRDSDEYIGHGHAPTLPAAILAALLRTAGYRDRRGWHQA